MRLFGRRAPPRPLIFGFWGSVFGICFCIRKGGCLGKTSLEGGKFFRKLSGGWVGSGFYGSGYMDMVSGSVRANPWLCESQPHHEREVYKTYYQTLFPLSCGAALFRCTPYF
jgi:hypothetical protein